MLGLIVIALMIWQVYKAAKESGRNAVLWAIGTLIGSLVLQFIIGFIFGVILGMGTQMWGWPKNLFETFVWPITIVILVINILLVWLLIRYLSRVPNNFAPPPPPPPNFN